MSWTPSDTTTYEKIEALNSEIMKHAERSITPKYSNRYEWSPALAQSIHVTRYWRLKLKRSRGLLVSNAALHTAREKARLPDANDKITTRQAVLDHLRAAIKNLREKQINHIAYRQTYLEDLEESLVLTRGNVDPLNTEKLSKLKAKQVKALIKREKKHQIYQKIRYTLLDNEENREGLCQINLPASIPLEPNPIGTPRLGRAHGFPSPTHSS